MQNSLKQYPSIWIALVVSVMAMPFLPTTTEAAPAVEAPNEVDYWRDVKPVLDARCVTCHACSDAPCQLNLTSHEGVVRGANKKPVYTSARLRVEEPTRLSIDARTTEGWRAKGFFSVLAEPAPGAGGARSPSSGGGLMLGMLALKAKNRGVAAKPSLIGRGDDQKQPQNCPLPEELDTFARRFPTHGMPYGLPPIADAEFAVLANWLARGAPAREPDPLDARYQQRIDLWEGFLNGPAAKQRLMSRYLYEHLFLANLYFSELDQRQFFRVIRSRTPPGQPIDLIATRVPFNDPGVSEFWYRIEPLHATVVAKTHLPYELSDARMARFQELFLDASFEVTQLPDYSAKVASNPFIAFKEMPVDSRYRFMLDDAEYFIRGFMKGPVCRGQVAVDVIDDRYWVVFEAPEPAMGMRDSAFLAGAAATLRLPAEEAKGPLGLFSWSGYKTSQMAYLMAKQQFLEQTVTPSRSGLNRIWDGDGHNSNAALTIFRHFDNASVVRGLIGSVPKTAWVIDYSLFERIHYLLVAGFDVFGSSGHQISTRLYMDFLRMDGEFNFISMLPAEERLKVRDQWYRDAHSSVREYVYGSRIAFGRETDIAYTSDNPRLELMQKFRARLTPVLDTHHELASEPDVDLRTQLERLAAVRAKAAALMPEVAFLTILKSADGGVDAHAVYTMIHDVAHTNVASLFREKSRLVPAEDELTLARGFVAAYPNAFFRVTRDELPAFVDAVVKLASPADYLALAAKFGVGRSSVDFWAHSDAIARAFSEIEPLDAGIFDFGRLKNP